MMQKITQLSKHDLSWSQPSAGKMEYELRSDGELVATLKFRSDFGTLATAESGDGCWTFKRSGFWQSKASIRACRSDMDLAVFKNNTWNSGGTLEFSDGCKFKATTNLWMTNFEFKTETDQPLVRFEYGGVFRRRAKVDISPLARSTPQVPLFVLFGWYLVIMLDSDAAGASAAIVSTM